MKKSLIIMMALILFISNINTVKAQKMNSVEQIMIIKNGSFPSTTAPATNFSGDVMVKMLFPESNPTDISSGVVTFEPLARTNWHSHPKGQVLYILSGVGQVQQWGGEITEVREGDVVWFPANVKHWHGATKNSAMSHLSFALIDDGKSSDWMEKVEEGR